MTTTQRAARAANLTEKVLLGFIAGAAAAIALVEAGLLIARVVDLLTGPVVVRRVPTESPVDAGFAGATFDRVDVPVSDPSAGIRGFLIASETTSSLLSIGICLVLAWLCLRVFLGRPFGSAATWGVGAVSLLVIIAGLGTPFFDGMAAQRVATDLGIAELPTFLVEVDLAPIGWGLAIAVVGSAFEIGQRLQRDTEGLV
ncbi:hypothetical protein [Salinibacterium sp. ZJ77]|uniref:hypothetical protein n=1 Tax=Salinibacterium sp. ZJ77 TaxID=2708337 RepID=UPI00142370AF|nr:hypothetical protein [Salinibacterium sp. ZJ77]